MPQSERLTPRLSRSLLFVPASKPGMIPKAAASEADMVCIDLEDSVVYDEKPAARGHAIRALKEIDFGRRARIVRMNPADTHLAYRDLVDVVEAAGDRVDLIMIPKVGSAREVVFVDMLLTQIEMQCGVTRRIGLEAQIETAAGFLNVREIAAASPRLEALVFGPGDFAASMLMPSTSIGELDQYDELYPGHRWHAVMQTIVAAARAHDLRCMDGPYAAYQDAAGLDRMALIARAMGFDGKQCIHPAQLPTVNKVFTPTDDEIRRAEAVLHAWEAAVETGQGAATHEGRMIDAVSYRLALVTLGRKPRN